MHQLDGILRVMTSAGDTAGGGGGRGGGGHEPLGPAAPRPGRQRTSGGRPVRPGVNNDDNADSADVTPADTSRHADVTPANTSRHLCRSRARPESAVGRPAAGKAGQEPRNSGGR